MELLVALVLVSVIAAGLAATTNLGVRLLDRTEKLPQHHAEISLRLRLRYWLSRSVPGALLANFETGLVGDATKLSFTTLAPAPFAPESAALRIHIDAAGADLIIIVEQLDDDGEVQERDQRILTRGITQARIAYYDTTGEMPDWRDVWDDTNRLPTLVRIVVDEGSVPDWPVFTVRLVSASTP